MSAFAGLHRALMEAVGPDQVLTEPNMVAGYVRDWTGRWTGETAAVVRPGTVAEVQQVMRICHDSGVAVVPQGGNTGLVGGSVPHHGEVVLSLLRLDWIGQVDAVEAAVTVGAGATIAAVDRVARRAGLSYGVDLASRDSATVGGTIATNAGGMKVVAYGDTRRQIIGLEVVWANGSSSARLTGPVKQSVGPDPLQLLAGSEGTLGVITAARLRLVPLVEGERFVILVGLETLSEGLGLLRAGVTTLEFFDQACLGLVEQHRGLSHPLSIDAPFYALVETGELPHLADTAPAVVDERLWIYRESITETINQQGIPCKLDVAVPLAKMDEFAGRVKTLELDGQTYMFGHLAEGNFHVNVVGSSDPDGVVDAVLGLVTELGGSIASEHGIGVAKAAWWRRTADPAMLAASRSVKTALDPRGILNPAVFWN
ncbi:MAG TPA: FAD-binding oxidoreductase [Acidimicrobiia bacterium]|nr:FAD-binding oxidoreductase [Acidimicrobiia bacterium]